MDISCHSFARMAHLAEPLMPQGGSLMTMSYVGAEEVIPGYGLMGPVKAALEASTRYLAAELGPGVSVSMPSRQARWPRARPRASPISMLCCKRPCSARLCAVLVDIDEVGALCTFLAGDGAKAITGSTLYVDAGYHILG